MWEASIDLVPFVQLKKQEKPLILVKLRVQACNSTKSNNPP